MARVGSARRHAQAVFSLALEEKALERWLKDLRTLKAQAADLRLLSWLESPKVRLQDKLSWAQTSLPGVHPLAVNLMSLLIVRARLSLLPGIVEEYERLVDAYHGIERAEVVTAVPLKDAEKRHLAQGLSTILDKKLRLAVRVDPEIIGGFMARVGDRLIDGSLRSRLKDLRRQLMAG